MQTAIAMHCEFTSCVLGFGMHETLPMQMLPTFCVNHADLAFPECPSGLTVHLKASLIPLQRSSHQQMQTNSHWEKERYQAQKKKKRKKKKCIKHIGTDHIKICSCWSSKSYPDRMTYRRSLNSSNLIIWCVHTIYTLLSYVATEEDLLMEVKWCNWHLNHMTMTTWQI